jgi:thiopeptide-type bacteriocin biosynthesis protein
MDPEYHFLPDLFLRVPAYSFADYDLERLPGLLADERFKNAIGLASHAFYRLLEAKCFDWNRLNDREQLTLYKYYNRMCFRPVPFGSFASFSLLQWGKGETVRLGSDDQAVLHLLPELQLRDHQDTVYKSGDTLRANPCLYLLGDEYRFYRSVLNDLGKYRFELESIAAEELHEVLFARLAKQEISAKSITALIVDHTSCTVKDAGDYLAFLVQSGVLFCPSQGSLIGPPVAPEFSGKGNLGKNVPGHLRVPLFAGIPLFPADGAVQSLYYAALEKDSTENGLGREEQEEIQSTLNALSRLPAGPAAGNLREFIRKFSDKFDLQKVPLLLALDPDSGISYGGLGAVWERQDMLADIRFPEQPEQRERIDWTDVQRMLFRLMQEAIKKGPQAVLQIHKDDIERLDMGGRGGVPANTLAVMFRKTAEYLHIEPVGLAAAPGIIGRFSAFSDDVTGLCRRLAGLETAANPGVLFADIGQLSDTHIDNINRRQQIYPFEIPLNVFSRSPAGTLLDPGDLVLSVRNGELILESLSLRKRVIPRLSTAYNYRNTAMPVFQLLCDLQYQGLQNALYLDLDRIFPGMERYPRVMIGRVIVSPAKWNLREKDWSGLLELASPVMKNMRGFREKYDLPQHVMLGAHDQQLVFDLANPVEAVFFLSCLKRLKRVSIQEYLAPASCVKERHKPYTGQFIAFLYHTMQVYRPLDDGAEILPGEDRMFSLGGEWLFVKIYCTTRSADQLLTGVIGPLISENAAFIKRWFFIRYQDPGHHLRLRILLRGEHTGRLLAALTALLKKSGNEKLVRKLTGDTYLRELERYGPEWITQTEEVFCAGSELVILYHSLQANGRLIMPLFHLAMQTALQLMLCCFDDMEELLQFTGRIAGGLFLEFLGGKDLKTDLDKKYRSLKPELEMLLLEPLPDSLMAAGYYRLLKDTRELVCAAAGNSMGEKQRRMSDILHMQLNRIFPAAQRRQEFLVYYFLEKLLRSWKARNKNGVLPARVYLDGTE